MMKTFESSTRFLYHIRVCQPDQRQARQPQVTLCVRGVISPLLANLFLHYAFDRWMQRNCPHIPFERYADDVICHCESKGQAKWLLGSIVKRMAECKLELNLQKNRI